MPEIPWWKEEEARSIERKAIAEQELCGVNSGDSFLIVTEGTVTEPIYFKYLCNELKLSVVEVHVVPGQHSHPLHVIETAVNLVSERKTELKKERENQSFSKTDYDHVWAVIDTDVAVRDGIWHKVQSAAAKGKVALACSTPCFEYWLLLHLKFSTAPLMNGADAKAALKAGGFDCSSEDVAESSVPLLINQWPMAVKNASKVTEYHCAARTPDPANPSTSLDLLLKSINYSLPASRRRL